MQFLQLKIALLICNQTVVSIATIWLQHLKVANIATINCTPVALGLLIFAVCNFIAKAQVLLDFKATFKNQKIERCESKIVHAK